MGNNQLVLATINSIIDPCEVFVFIRRAERVLSPMKQREVCSENFHRIARAGYCGDWCPCVV